MCEWGTCCGGSVACRLPRAGGSPSCVRRRHPLHGRAKLGRAKSELTEDRQEPVEAGRAATVHVLRNGKKRGRFEPCVGRYPVLLPLAEFKAALGQFWPVGAPNAGR